MGVYSDIIAAMKAEGKRKGGSAIQTMARAIEEPISRLRAKRGDPAYPAGLAASSAIQLIQPFPATVREGEFSLTVRLRGRRPFTTLNLAFDATAEQVSQAIDQAAVEDRVTSYTPGDIKVVMASDLNNSGMALVFNGMATQRRNHAKVRVNDLGLKSDPLRRPNHEASDSLTIPAFCPGVRAGRFFLHFSHADGGNCLTTAFLPHDATAADVELAIDDAATAAEVADWVNGDIAVSGGPLTTNDLSLTLAGERELRVLILSRKLRGHTKTGSNSMVVRGQPRRTALATLNLLGLVDLPSPLPLCGSVDGVTLAERPRLKRFKRETIHLLCKQAGREEKSRDVFRNLMMLFGLRHLAQ
jgi:hypothetical protein